MRYRLVCLDAGFTLLTPRRTLADALAGVLEERGHPVDREDLHKAWEAADRWFWDEYHRPRNDTWADDAAIDRTWREYHAVMLRELGFADAQHDLLEAILAGQYAADAWETYPDVEPALVALRRMPGLTTCVISDWGSNLEAIVAGLGLDRYLDFTLASGAVGFAKPDPALFRVALERAGVEPSEAVMVGDSLRADVEGARAAGMEGILLARPAEAADGHAPGPPDVPPDTRVISTLAELPDIVAGTKGPHQDHRQAARRMA
ncbi:MAG TPA: HAD-IA family hydrolase [Candidatus Limnocylindria bacterium]|nr:HAD-IA family hydrolase [Candidatus Limnocylindria bacterium]